MDSRFTNQVVVVTGAASGIGVVIAKHFADAGARLVLSDVDEKRLNSVAEDIATSQPSGLATFRWKTSPAALSNRPSRPLARSMCS